MGWLNMIIADFAEPLEDGHFTPGSLEKEATT